MKNFRCVIAAVFLAILTSSVCAQTLWRQYGFNPAHTSYNDAEMALSPLTVGRLTLFWTSDTFRGIATSPVLGYQAVFVASDGRVRSLDKQDGHRHWARFSCSGENTVQPALGRRILMVGDGGGDLAGYDPATGNQIVCDDKGGSIVSALAVADDTVFYSNTGEIVATDQFTSRDHWRADTGSTIMPTTSPAVADGVVYAAAGDFVFAFDGITGRRLWRHHIGEEQVNISSPSVANGLVYVGGVHLYALSAIDGHLVWRNRFVGTNVSTPAIAEGRVFVNSEDPEFGLWAFDAASGALLWKTRKPGESLATVTVANGVVYDITEFGELMMFDAASGNLLATIHDPDGKPFNADFGSQPIVADGVVYVSTGDFASPNRVDAFRLGP